MAVTKHTSYRITDRVKKKLLILSEMDGMNATATISRLINAEYSKRLDEIKIFKKSLKISPNSEIIKDK